MCARLPRPIRGAKEQLNHGPRPAVLAPCRGPPSTTRALYSAFCEGKKQRGCCGEGWGRGGVVRVKVRCGDSIKTHKHMEAVSISVGAGSSRRVPPPSSLFLFFFIFCLFTSHRGQRVSTAGSSSELLPCRRLSRRNRDDKQKQTVSALV